MFRTNKHLVEVRLFGIDAPELHQPYGPEAKAALVLLTKGKQLRLQKRNLDRYGRTVGELFLPDGTSIAEILLADGCAWWYRTLARGELSFEKAEDKARRGHKGLWAASNPTPPWVWRESHRRETH